MAQNGNFKIEQADTMFAQWLLSLPIEVLKNLVWNDTSNENGEGINDPDTHIRMMTNYLEEIIVNDGHVSRNYSYPDRTPGIGRRSVGKSFGLQFCKKTIRGPLAAPYYNDFDMINCHPTLILYLVKSFMPPSTRVPHLEQYIANRQKILDENNVTKTAINAMINKGWYDDTIDIDATFVHNLDNEIKQIQRYFYDNLPESLNKYAFIKDVLKKDKKGNEKARFLGMIVMAYEDRILKEAEKAIGEKNVDVLMYDGFFVKKNLPIAETIEKLNKVTKKYGVKWSHKPHDLSIKIDEELQPIKDRSQLKLYTYDSLKEEFEKDYKLIKNPCVFVNLYEGIGGSIEMGFHNQNDIKLLTADKCFKKATSKGIVNVSFFPEWLKDENKKTYTHPVFYPGVLPAGNQGFNTFTGFNATSLTCEKRNNLVNAFIQSVNNLTNNQPDYLIKYIAHIFQKPEQLPGIAILFQSEEGYGKDTLRQMIAKLIGNKYIHETSDMESIFGSFNSSLANKLLLVLNEMEGKNGCAYKDRMKALWTAELVELNEKNVKRWKQQNFMRAFIYSNNKRPIQIPYDDRRYVVYRSTLIKPPQEFFDSTYALMDEPEEQLGLYDYLMNIDLTDFNIKKRPHTDVYETMKTSSISPLYEFIYDLLDNKIKNIKCHKKGKNHFYIGSSLFNRYVKWCAEQHLKNDINNVKHMSTMLESFGVSYKRILLDIGKYYCIIINDIDFTCEMIKSKGLIQDVEKFEGYEVNYNGCDEGVDEDEDEDD